MNCLHAYYQRLPSVPPYFRTVAAELQRSVAKVVAATLAVFISLASFVFLTKSEALVVTTITCLSLYFLFRVLGKYLKWPEIKKEEPKDPGFHPQPPFDVPVVPGTEYMAHFKVSFSKSSAPQPPLPLQTKEVAREEPAPDTSTPETIDPLEELGGLSPRKEGEKAKTPPKREPSQSGCGSFVMVPPPSPSLQPGAPKDPEKGRLSPSLP